MRIVLTGATGFLGGYLLRTLARKHEVFAITRSNRSIDAPSAVNWIIQDLTRSFGYSELPNRVDAIIHLAQSRFYKDFPDRAQDIFDVNTRSTLHLLEYGGRVGIDRFIYASSGGVYGFGGKEFLETDPVNPTNFYLSSKWCAEMIIAHYKEFFSTIILRPFFIYGEGQPSSMLVPRLIHSVREGNAILLQGTDGMRINPIYVDDAAAAFERALTVEGSHLINVAGPQVLSLRQVGNIIGEQVNCSPVFEVHRDAGLQDLIGDLTKMKSLLGSPQTSFREGIAGLCRED